MPQPDRPMGYRMPPPNALAGLGAGLNGKDVTITIGPADSPEVQDAGASAGATFSTQADGSVIVNLEPDSPEASVRGEDNSFDTNLAEVISEQYLGAIAAEVLDGVRADEQSRSAWVATYRDNIDLLGLKIESSSEAGDNQSVSKVRHPVLLEAVVKFQAGAGAEMLPAAGPAKVQVAADDTTGEDKIATAFERDFNYYLTTTATEFYPDTDRMHFYLGYGGCAFKKVYECPLRERPVSEAVYLPDLIVSYDATDLQNAQRVTHQIRMTKGDARRMMITKAWRQVDLIQPTSQPTTIEVKVGEVQGIQQQSPRPQDSQHVFYESYTELDLSPYGIKNKGEPKGMPLPYRVTLERDSRQVVEIRRDWKESDKLFRRRKHFVKYGLVPGFGFYDLGFLHLIGNQTKALTAIWRILVDAGMFNNFPGGVKVKGTRQSTNQIRPNPGQWVEIDTGPIQDITKALMPMPYKEPSAVLLQLAEVIGQDAQRMGSAVEIEVGEGRTNVPVGTIMAQIEQQTQVMQAVHKRLHRAQKEELLMLRDLFIENPKALTKFSKDPQRQWQLASEFSDLNLVPASDPNVPAQIHRIMLAVALTMLAAQAGPLYDQHAVQKRVLAMINISNPDELLVDPKNMPPGGAAPDPKVTAATITSQGRLQEATLEAQSRAASDAVKERIETQKAEGQAQDRALDAKETAIKAQSEGVRAETEATAAHADHQLDIIKTTHDMAMDRHDAALGAAETHHKIAHETAQGALQSEAGLGAPSI